MNFYQKHTGDFLKETMGYSATQKGMYSLLMDLYFIVELPLPLDVQEISGLINCKSKHENDALKFVLDRRFTKCDDGYRQSGWDLALEKYKGRCARAKVIGRLGGRPRAQNDDVAITDQVSSGLSNTSNQETQGKANHEPVSINQNQIAITQESRLVNPETSTDAINRTIQDI